MKNRVLVLSHGTLAGSLVETLKLIYGSTEGLAYINMPNPFDKDVYSKLIEEKIKESDGLLILCDLLGGSPFITCCSLMREYGEKFELVTGVNLGMLLEIMSKIEEADILELKEAALSAGENGIVDVKERLGNK